MGIWAALHHWQVSVIDVLVSVFIVLLGVAIWGAFGRVKRRSE